MWNTTIMRMYGADYPFVGPGTAMIGEPRLVSVVSATSTITPDPGNK